MKCQAGLNGAQQAGSWAVRETFVAVVIGNIPMIYPLFVRIIKQLSQSLSSFRSTGTGSHGTPIKDFIKVSRKPRSANPLTISSSAERIIEDRMRKMPQTTERPLDVADADEGQGGGGRNRIHVANHTTVDFELVEVGVDVPSRREDSLNGNGSGRSYCYVSTTTPTV